MGSVAGRSAVAVRVDTGAQTPGIRTSERIGPSNPRTYVIGCRGTSMPTPTPADAGPELYDRISELETPALVVDLDAMDRNVALFTEFAEDHDVRLRSHVKTHKIPELAHLQHERSDGGGILCQKPSEAEVMAAGGIDDIYLSYQVVGERKLDRLVALSEKVEEFATTVDSPGNVLPLQDAAARHDATVHAVLEVDPGMGRTGVPLGEAAVEMAELVDEQPNLVLDGIMSYEAHVKSDADTESELARLCAEMMDATQETVDRIEDAAIPVEEVKVGGTATSRYSGTHPVVTEINPGMYPFNDVGELRNRHWEVEKADCAATVIATVISAPTGDRAVCDAGSKTISMDTSRMPVPKYRDDVEYVNYSEEHGWLDTSAVPGGLDVGDRVEFIVPHVCTSINLHDTLLGVREGRVEEIWNVQARGKVR
jgi:D-serine deaminase-like pyridoxal phosphate-dependent protein